MPRANPYKPQYDFNGRPSMPGTLLFVGLLAAIILAAIVWASYLPDVSEMPPAGSTQHMTTPPALPQTPAPTR